MVFIAHGLCFILAFVFLASIGGSERKTIALTTTLCLCASLILLLAVWSYEEPLTDRLIQGAVLSAMWPFVLFGFVFENEFTPKLSQSRFVLLIYSFAYLVLQGGLYEVICACVFALPLLWVLFKSYNQKPFSKSEHLVAAATSLLLYVALGAPVVCGFVVRYFERQLQYADLPETFLCACTIIQTIFALLALALLKKPKSAKRDSSRAKFASEGAEFARTRLIQQILPLKMHMLFALIHGGPLLFNGIFKIIEPGYMLSYALILSPLLTFEICDRVYPTSMFRSRRVSFEETNLIKRVS